LRPEHNYELDEVSASGFTWSATSQKTQSRVKQSTAKPDADIKSVDIIDTANSTNCYSTDFAASRLCRQHFQRAGKVMGAFTVHDLRWAIGYRSFMKACVESVVLGCDKKGCYIHCAKNYEYIHVGNIHVEARAMTEALRMCQTESCILPDPPKVSTGYLSGGQSNLRRIYQMEEEHA